MNSMTQKEFMDIFNLYLDEHGMMARVPGELHDGNPLLYMATAIVMFENLYKDNLITSAEWETLLYKCEALPGVLHRSPIKRDLEAHDDYVGVLAACKALDTYDMAMRIYRHGLETGFVYNNTNKKTTIKSDFSRFFDVVPHFKACLNVRLDLWDQVRWTLGIIGKALWGNESSVILGWLMVQSIGNDYFPCNIGKIIFNWCIPSMRLVFEKYFYPEHLFAVACKDL